MHISSLDPGLVPASNPRAGEHAALLADVARCLQAQLAGVDGGASLRVWLHAVSASTALELVAVLLIRPRAIARAWHGREGDDHGYRRLLERLSSLPRAVPIAIARVSDRTVRRFELPTLPAALVRRAHHELDELDAAFESALDVVSRRFATRLRPQRATARHRSPRVAAQAAGATT